MKTSLIITTDNWSRGLVLVLAPLMALFSGQPRARCGGIWLVQAQAV